MIVLDERHPPKLQYNALRTRERIVVVRQRWPLVPTKNPSERYTHTPRIARRDTVCAAQKPRAECHHPAAGKTARRPPHTGLRLDGAGGRKKKGYRSQKKEVPHTPHFCTTATTHGTLKGVPGICPFFPAGRRNASIQARSKIDSTTTCCLVSTHRVRWGAPPCGWLTAVLRVATICVRFSISRFPTEWRRWSRCDDTPV
jgi:hypothetical protein